MPSFGLCVLAAGTALAQLALLGRLGKIGLSQSLQNALFQIVGSAGLLLIALAAGSNLALSPTPWVAASAFSLTVVAWRSARQTGQLTFKVFSLAGLIWLELCAVFFYGVGLWRDATDLGPRALLLMAPAMLLCASFGASLGLLSACPEPQGRPQHHWEIWIARRLLVGRQSQILSSVTRISLVGGTLGVWLVLVSLGILSGFEHDLTDKIISTTAHVTLTRQDGAPFVSPDTLREWPGEAGIEAAIGVVESDIAVASGSNYQAGLLYGADIDAAKGVLPALERVRSGKLQSLTETPSDGKPGDARVALGSELAHSLQVSIGDSIRLIAPGLETLTPLGVVPKSTGAHVVAIVESGMFDFDARSVLCSTSFARHFLEVADDEVTAIQVRLSAPERTEPAEKMLRNRAKLAGISPAEILSYKTRNQTLFMALKLERAVAFIVLTFIILVASFSVVNTLTMSILEKKAHIAILKTLGARDTSIMKIFLVQGLLIGGSGTLMGGVLGIVTMLALSRFGFWIPGEVYYIDSLPVRLDLSEVVLVVTAALLVVWDFAVFPALQGSRLRPIEGLRDG